MYRNRISARLDRWFYSLIACLPIVLVAIAVAADEEQSTIRILERKSKDTSLTRNQASRPESSGRASRISDYRRTRLALTLRGAAIKSATAAAETAIAELDKLARESFTSCRKAEQGVAGAAEVYKSLSERLDATHKRHDVEEILGELDRADPDACLRLMVQLDWVRQDGGEGAYGFQAMAADVMEQLGKAGAELACQRQRLVDTNASRFDGRWMQLYLDACHQRRVARLSPGNRHVFRARHL